MDEVFLFLKQKDFLAPWVQAILSALAVLIAYELGLRQSRNQLTSAMRVTRAEQRFKAFTFLETILAIADQAGEIFPEASRSDSDVLIERFYRYDPVQIDDLVQSLSSIPLHQVPVPKVATQLLRLRNSTRQLAVVRNSFESIKDDFNRDEGDRYDLSPFAPAFSNGVDAIARIRALAGEYRDVT